MSNVHNQKVETGVMGNVSSFSGVIAVVDVLINVVLVIACFAGLILTAKHNGADDILGMLTVFGVVVLVWLFKTLAFGMAFCAIAIAENTHKATK